MEQGPEQRIKSSQEPLEEMEYGSLFFGAFIYGGRIYLAEPQGKTVFAYKITAGGIDRTRPISIPSGAKITRIPEEQWENYGIPKEIPEKRKEKRKPK